MYTYIYTYTYVIHIYIIKLSYVQVMRNSDQKILTILIL